MEHAPLRPVPARPTGPVDTAAAEAAVRGMLPALDELPARALALVALAGRPRREAALRLQTAEDELAFGLALARKALRRTLVELPGSGWCERAERLVSDRLDGTLDDTGAARLDVHLRNCSRCVEHERRLVQATDALLGSVSAPPPEPPAADPPTPVEPPAVAEPAEPARLPAPEPPRALPDLARAVSWNVLLVLAVLLALASLALAVAGVVGADL